MSTPICSIKQLPEHEWLDAAASAPRINPANAPADEFVRSIVPEADIEPEHLALLTAKYWGSRGVRLTVGFLDGPAADLRARILLHMNAWAATSNVQFVETAGAAQVRIARLAGDGYWSYLAAGRLYQRHTTGRIWVYTG